MPRRGLPFVPGHYYHLYNRSHNRDTIFLESDNYTFFLNQLRSYLVPTHAVVLAYVLMPNHYHLLIQAQTEEISHAMQLLGISFTKAMNKRFERTGSFFQGAFRAKLVDQQEYLLHLSRYIHLNPVRATLVQTAEEWVYSSYREYLGLRNGTLPCPEIVLQEFAVPVAAGPDFRSLGDFGSLEGTATLALARQRYRTFVESYAAHDRGKIAHLLFAE